MTSAQSRLLQAGQTFGCSLMCSEALAPMCLSNGTTGMLASLSTSSSFSGSLLRLRSCLRLSMYTTDEMEALIPCASLESQSTKDSSESTHVSKYTLTVKHTVPLVRHVSEETAYGPHALVPPHQHLRDHGVIGSTATYTVSVVLHLDVEVPVLVWQGIAPDLEREPGDVLVASWVETEMIAEP